MNCASLLAFVETRLPDDGGSGSAMSFGHPLPPQVQLLSLPPSASSSSSLLSIHASSCLVLAHSQRGVAAVSFHDGVGGGVSEPFVVHDTAQPYDDTGGDDVMMEETDPHSSDGGVPDYTHKEGDTIACVNAILVPYLPDTDGTATEGDAPTSTFVDSATTTNTTNTTTPVAPLVVVVMGMSSGRVVSRLLRGQTENQLIDWTVGRPWNPLPPYEAASEAVPKRRRSLLQPHPFPSKSGPVTSIHVQRHNDVTANNNQTTAEDTKVWISYSRDSIRLPLSMFVQQEYPTSLSSSATDNAIVKLHCQMAGMEGHNEDGQDGTIVVPCPELPQASPIALLPTTNARGRGANPQDEDVNEQDALDRSITTTTSQNTSMHPQEEYQEEDELKSPDQSYSALIYYNSNAASTAATTTTTTTSGSNNTSGLGGDPTLTLYTSEDLFVGRLGGNKDVAHDDPMETESELFNVAVGASTALVRGVVGVVQWGLGRSQRSVADDTTNATETGDETNTTTAATATTDEKEMDISLSRSDAVSTGATATQSTTLVAFSELHQGTPVLLYPGSEWHDAPRQLETVVVHGTLAATTDTLGRVCLIDLTTFQLVRMWKGVRDATVHFFGSKFIAIHSAQRRTVEVYKLRHGPRLRVYTVGRDAQLVECLDRKGNKSCFILHATEGVLELVEAQDEAAPSMKRISSKPSLVSMGQSLGASEGASMIQESTMRLQALQQMLSETNVPCKTQHVLDAFTRIKMLQDLASALDVLSTAVSLEDRVGVRGSDFHEAALKHSQTVLDRAVQGQGADVTESPPVVLLRDRIVFHTQMVEAYKALNEFETTTLAKSKSNNNDNKNDSNDPTKASTAEATRLQPKSYWAIEAASWIRTHETVLGKDTLVAISREQPTLRFADFCRCCARPGDKAVTRRHHDGRFRIYFSDSSKTRREALIHVFEPLMQDVFSYPVVNNILDGLGLDDDPGYVLSCFGEWFMTRSPQTMSHKAFFVLQSPLTKWIQERVSTQIDKALEESDSFSSQTALAALHDHCERASDLVRAFVLAATARDAVSSVTKKAEVKTYGKVWKTEAVQPWETLLRKIRVCLLVSLRLKDVPLGPFPITVRNVEAPDIFSVYQWIAHDELLLSHKQEEITALEKACAGSKLVFDPSSPAGDNPSRWKQLQQACLAMAITDDERAEYLVDLEDDMQGALLLYMSNHNNGALLAAHRALLLAGYWLEQPSRIPLLQDCADALSGMDESEMYRPLATAVRLEVWQKCIRPVFRALFFGFDEVHEISSDVFHDLFGQPDWIRTVGKTALLILRLLAKLDTADVSSNRKAQIPDDGDRNGWPGTRQDLILQHVLEKSRPVVGSAIDMHRAVVSGAIVSNDYASLAECLHGFYESFEHGALWNVGQGASGDGNVQMVFLERAIVSHARDFAPNATQLELDEMETLAVLWSIDVRDVRTIFLLAMYEYGKDAMLEDFWSSPGSRNGVDLGRFVEDGVALVCRRFHFILHERRSPSIRAVLSLLDAETLEWVADQADFSVSLLDEEEEMTSPRRGTRQVLDVPLAVSHIMVLRLLSMGSALGAAIPQETSLKLHSLSVLSGTLKRELENKRT